MLYSDINNIRLAPAYDVVCTTVYIQQDIPALTLTGSKKWFSRTHLERFGVQACDLSASRARDLFEECLNALGRLLPYLAMRLNQNSDSDQLRVLEHLQTLITNQIATSKPSR